MKHADIVAVGDRRYEDVDRREAVVTDPRELVVSVEREPFDVGVDCQVGERTQLSEELVVVACATRGVAGFEEEGDTGRSATYVPSFEARAACLPRSIKPAFRNGDKYRSVQKRPLTVSGEFLTDSAGDDLEASARV